MQDEFTYMFCTKFSAGFTFSPTMVLFARNSTIPATEQIDIIGSSDSIFEVDQSFTLNVSSVSVGMSVLPYIAITVFDNRTG